MIWAPLPSSGSPGCSAPRLGACWAHTPAVGHVALAVLCSASLCIIMHRERLSPSSPTRFQPGHLGPSTILQLISATDHQLETGDTRVLHQSLWQGGWDSVALIAPAASWAKRGSTQPDSSPPGWGGRWPGLCDRRLSRPPPLCCVLGCTVSLQIHVLCL